MDPAGDGDPGRDGDSERDADSDPGRDADSDRDADPDSERDADPEAAAPAPGLPWIARVKSAALWGVVGALAFLVGTQGYLLVGGDLPFGYAGLVPIAAVVGLGSGGLAYLTEHRLVAKGRT